MSGFLEAVGILSIIAIVGYLYLKHLDNEIYRKNENRKLAQYSEKGQEYIRKHDGTIMSAYDYDKGLEKILNNPEERAIAEKNKQEYEEWHRKLEEENISRQKEERKFGYKYENDIFEIFDSDVNLSKNELLIRMENHFYIDKLQAENLLKLWCKNSLIMTWGDNNTYIVGFILTLNSLKLTDSDMTRDKWLEINGKKQEYDQKVKNRNERDSER